MTNKKIVMKKIVILVLCNLLLLFNFTACFQSKEAKAVDKQIAEIGLVSLESEAVIVDAENAVKNLLDEDKKQLRNFKKLLKMREKYDDLVIHEKANKIVSDINSIGEITLKNEKQIKAIRENYDEQEQNVKELITNYSVLQDAELQLSDLKIKLTIDTIESLATKQDSTNTIGS